MTKDEALRRAAPVLAAMVREHRERQARAAEHDEPEKDAA